MPRRHRLAIAAITVLALAACDDSGEPEATAAGAGGATTTIATTATSSPATTGAAAPEQAAEAETLPTRSDIASTVHRSPVFGGIEFAVPDDRHFFTDGDGVVVMLEVPDEGPPPPSAAVSLWSQLIDGAPLTTTQEFLDAIGSIDGAVIEATGTEIEILGEVATGYEISWPDRGGPEFVLGSQRRGTIPTSGHAPGPFAVVYLAETPSGVLAAEISGNAPEDVETMGADLGSLIASLELTGPGFDPALPEGSDLTGGELDDPPPPVPADEGGDGPPPLNGPFSEAASGRAEITNFGLAVSIEVPAGWAVQPNFPGIVVLTAGGSLGPDDRDLVWTNDVTHLQPITGGPVAAGEPVPVDDVDAFLASPPPGLVIGEVTDRTLTGSDGSTQRVVDFAVEADANATCALDDPCAYAFVTSHGVTEELPSTHRNHVWWFPDHLNGPGIVVASAPGAGPWVDEAVAAMSTLELR